LPDLACHAQYVEFLGAALPLGELAALLPPIRALVQDYGVDPEVAFHVRCYAPFINPPPPAGSH
jgi:hypothetical protein